MKFLRDFHFYVIELGQISGRIISLLVYIKIKLSDIRPDKFIGIRLNIRHDRISDWIILISDRIFDQTGYPTKTYYLIEIKSSIFTTSMQKVSPPSSL